MSVSAGQAVRDWLLDSDPAVRWQVLRDLAGAPAGTVAAERARVAREGWGSRILALQGKDGQWEGGALFPARRPAVPGQPWTATAFSLVLLRDLGVDPRDEAVRQAVGRVRENSRWEHAGQPFFSGEVEPCINGMVVGLGAYFGVDVDGVVAPEHAPRRGPLDPRRRRRPAQPVEHAPRAAGPAVVRAVTLAA